MISKELLSEICQTNLMSLGKLEVVGSDICLYDCSMQPDIYMCWNIYELAHKCKEWAFNNGFGLTSGLLNYSKTKIAVIENIDLLMPKISFTDNTEPEAIFKACQWILNKDSK